MVKNPITMQEIQVRSLGHEDTLENKIATHSSLVAQLVKNLPAVQETRVWSLAWEDLLEKEMVTHSSILAWNGQRSLVGCSPWGHKESGTTEWLILTYKYSCLKNPMNRGAWQAIVRRGHKEWGTTEWITLSIWLFLCLSSDKMWSTREGNCKPLQHSCLESPMNSTKGKKMNWKMNHTHPHPSPGWYVSNMLLEKSREIALEGMKRLR